MRYLMLALALSAVAVPSPSAAQLMCATALGTCMIGGPSAPGGPCFCVTRNGPVQGIARPVGASGGQSTMPQFCCTPAGRMGPFNNTSVGPGQFCQAMTPTGPLAGQACF